MKEGVFSAWKGQGALKFLPAFFKLIYSEIKEALKSDNQLAEIIGMGGGHSALSGRLGSLSFGRQVIEKPIVHISDNFAGMSFPDYIDGLLGVEILRKFNLLIDYSENRIYFDRRN